MNSNLHTPKPTPTSLKETSASLDLTGKSEQLVLHIAADFPNQDIYPQLVSSLWQTGGVEQAVLSAVRSRREADWIPPPVPGVSYDIHNVLRTRHRYLFRTKIKLIASLAEAKIPLPRVAVVHAHCLYSDGAVALRLFQKFGLPFISAVRNVDINAFMRFRPDLNAIRDQVLKHARAIIFISPAYKESFLNALPSRVANQLITKSHVIPNGVAPMWLQQAPLKTTKCQTSGDTLKLLYVGDFSANKNLRGLIAAVEILRQSTQVELTVVGGTTLDAREAGLPQPGFVQFVGRVLDRHLLRDIYRQHHIFVMPSFTETFGVAYIEALSQGLPIVYSVGQGVDGFFAPGGVAEGVNPNSAASIAQGILSLAARQVYVAADCVAEASRFDWSRIATRYCEIYRAAHQ